MNAGERLNEEPIPNKSISPKLRISYLDGLRGVAISLVAFYHFYGNKPWQLPYGAKFADNIVIAMGWIGVYLFFLISGFVIFMTIEKCPNFLEFMKRRWLRLFPAMLAASILTFAVARLVSVHGPSTGVSAIDFIPGLTFISPSFWHVLLRQEIRSIDNVYWTLYVEMAFYIIFGLLYFAVGWRKAIAGLLALSLITALGPEMIANSGLPKVALRAFEPLQWIGVDSFGWFAAGAMFFKAKQSNSAAMLGLGIMIGLTAALTMHLPILVDNTISRAFLSGTVLAFALIQFFHHLQRPLELRSILLLGFVSYPFYLLHYHLGIVSIHLLHPYLGDYAAPCLTFAGIAGLCWLIAGLYEPAMRRILASWIAIAENYVRHRTKRREIRTPV